MLAGAMLATLFHVGLTRSADAQPFDRRTPVVIAVEKVGPAVVNILTTRVEQRSTFGWWFDPRAPRTYKATSLGSGVLIDSVGLVVTNEHVVRNAADIQVHLSDGRRLKARRIEQAIPSLDLALLQIEAGPEEVFPYVKLGRGSDILVGETVVAIGNPFGLENTVTTGVISAKNRSITPPLGSQVSYRNLLQTDASINPGNSGGALVNINAELIGINTAIHARGEGIGFAIPVDALRTNLVNLLRHEMLDRGQNLGLDVDENAKGGVFVSAINEEGPAFLAGVRVGDHVRAIERRRIRDRLDYSLALYAISTRPEARMMVHRATKALELEIRLPRTRRERIQNYLAELQRLATTGELGASNREVFRRIGVRAVSLTPRLRDLFRLPSSLQGVVVLELDRTGPAANVGFQRHDVLVSFGVMGPNEEFLPRLGIGSVKELADALGKLSRRRSVAVQVYRRGDGFLYGELGLRR